jgi:hypothetical protein
MIIKINNGHAEIIIEPASKVMIGAEELVRLLLAHGVTVAKIIRTTQTAKESPLSAVCDQTGERAVITP